MQAHITDIFNSILTVQSHSGHERAMKKQVKNLLTDYATLSHDSKGNLYAHVADGLPLVVAHLDTVHRVNPSQHLVPIQIGDLVTGIAYPSMKQSGIGGDDKCGIYAAVTLIREGLVNGFFPVEEEIGCVGSRQANTKTLETVWGTPFAMQADRRGASDIVFFAAGTQLAGPDFISAVTQYTDPAGYKQAAGMITDVWALVDIGCDFPTFNISAGYYNPHQDTEYINLKELDNTIQTMRTIAVALNGQTFDSPQRHQPERPKATKWGAWGSKMPSSSGWRSVAAAWDAYYDDSRWRSSKPAATNGPAYAYNEDDEKDHRKDAGRPHLTDDEIDAMLFYGLDPNSQDDRRYFSRTYL